MSALLELGAGAALLLGPSTTVEILVGAPLENSAASTVARVGGAGLLALGAACWLARDDAHSRAARGLITAMVLYNLGAVLILVAARIQSRSVGLGLWPAVVLHAVMTVLCIMSLSRQSARPVE